MKKVSGGVFRPWDSDSHHHQLTVIKTELPDHQLLEETIKKEDEAKDEKDPRQGPTDGHLGDSAQLGLESGLAIAMRGLVGPGSGRSAAMRWNLGSCLRGLVMGQPQRPLLPPHPPHNNRLENNFFFWGGGGGEEPRTDSKSHQT
jgi:hypothetical protein